jgi:outer membrane protein OmpA-like peptidoglycan-associated protein
MIGPRIGVLGNPRTKAVQMVCTVLLLAGCGTNKPAQPSDRGSASSSSPLSPSTTAQAHPPADLNQTLQQLGLKESEADGASGDSGGGGTALPHFPPASTDTTAASRITLQPGLTIVESVDDKPLGDYEVVISVDTVSQDAVHLTISSEGPDAPSGSDSSHPSTQKVTSKRSVSQQDSLHADAMMTLFSEMFPESIPGTTAIAVSQDTMRKIKEGGTANLTGPKGGLTGRVGVIAALGGSALSRLSGDSEAGRDFWSRISKQTCAMRRLEPQDAAFPVLLNGRRVTLPAVHTLCKGENYAGDDYILDNDTFPLLLSGNSTTAQIVGQVTQINYPAPMREPPNAAPTPKGSPKNSGSASQGIEKALQKGCHADVYGLYFDFDRYELRPESEPALREIAEALKNNQSLKLLVAGHTDNIGGDDHNQKLSEQRAAAVKDALVSRYQIASTRLSTLGFGAKRPIETNATIEGRARNRRVELSCQ